MFNNVRGSGRERARLIGRRTLLEKAVREGENPVVETERRRPGTQSTTGHEKPCGKTGGPSPKAKYDLMTDRV